MTTEAEIEPARDREDSNTGLARERILEAAGELFAERGYDATPTSRIAENARVPKGLIHYYFKRKEDILVALVERLPEQRVRSEEVVVRGDLTGSLRALVGELDRRLRSSLPLSHLLWREADTHEAVRSALNRRFQQIVEQTRHVIEGALPGGAPGDIDTASVLLARAINHDHATARLRANGVELDREIRLIARALGAGRSAEER
ncbi:TetR/AcrR family transcriptional regulator [Actinopolyspora saharensis]|uniref:TetR/AcrR family transcriptional regulator n=1 Tax=Actinopolyspora saharensis TaxID=995062 RepID=UPI003F67B0B1